MHFVRKLKKGKGKYKGKLPFKCFNCGGIGHFAVNCPHKDKNQDDESLHKESIGWKTNLNFRKGNFKKKIFIFNNISSSKASSNEDL